MRNIIFSCFNKSDPIYADYLTLYIEEAKNYGIIDNNLINMNTAKINLKSHRKEDNIEREEVLVKVKH